MKKMFAVMVMLCILILPHAACAGDSDIVIKGGTEVLLKSVERLTSKQAHAGQVVRFVVERSVVNDDGFTLIEGGASAYATVTKVAKAGLFGAGGKIEIMVNSVEAYNGKVIQLSGNRGNEGENVTGVAVIGALVTPWTLLFRGSNAVIEAGTIFSAYVSNTTVLEEVPDAPPPEPKPAPVKKTVKKTAKKRR